MINAGMRFATDAHGTLRIALASSSASAQSPQIHTRTRSMSLQRPQPDVQVMFDAVRHAIFEEVTACA